MPQCEKAKSVFPTKALVGTHRFQLALDLTRVQVLPLRGNHQCLLLCKLSLSFNCLALWSPQLIKKRVSIHNQIRCRGALRNLCRTISTARIKLRSLTGLGAGSRSYR